MRELYITGYSRVREHCASLTAREKALTSVPLPALWLTQHVLWCHSWYSLSNKVAPSQGYHM